MEGIVCKSFHILTLHGFVGMFGMCGNLCSGQIILQNIFVEAESRLAGEDTVDNKDYMLFGLYVVECARLTNQIADTSCKGTSCATYVQHAHQHVHTSGESAWESVGCTLYFCRSSLIYCS